MRRAFGFGIALLLAACDTASPVAAPSNDSAIGAAERQAVGDTDGAFRDAAAPESVGTNDVTDRSSR